MTDSEENEGYVAHCLEQMKLLLTPANVPDPNVLQELLRLREHTLGQFDMADAYIKDYEKDFKKEFAERQRLREENYSLKWEESNAKARAETDAEEIRKLKADLEIAEEDLDCAILKYEELEDKFNEQKALTEQFSNQSISS